MKIPHSVMWKSTALAALVLATSPLYALGRTLERDNFGPTFKVSEIKSDSARRLRLQALDQMTPSQITSSRSEPLRLKTKIIDKELLVTIAFSPPRRYQKIEYMIDIPTSVTRVLFGTNKKEIWPVDEFYSSDERHAMSTALTQFKADYPETHINEYFCGISPMSSTNRRDTVCVMFGTFDPKDGANSITYEVEKSSNTARRVKLDEFAKSLQLPQHDH